MSGGEAPTDEAQARGAEEPGLRGLAVGELLRAAARRAPDRLALVEGADDAATRRRWTYAELLADAERVARAMLARFHTGEHIAIWAPNVPEYQLVQFGAALAGLVIVTVNPAFRRDEALYGLDFAEVAGVFAVREFRGHRPYDLAAELRGELPLLREVVDIEDLGGFAADADEQLTLPDVDPSSPAQILYTSGTTGRPKGALLAHRAITDNAWHGAANIAGAAADRAVWIATLPMFHLAGCVVASIGTVALGGTFVSVRAFDAELVIRLIEEEGATTTNIVPTLMWAILRHPDWTVRDTSSFRSVMLGGAPVPPELARRVHEEGIVPIVGYGLTEASLVTGTSDGDSVEDLLTTIGRPLPHVEVRIVDPATGAVLRRGERGEIQTRGFHTFIGYWRNPEATADAFADGGWLRTGDLGVMDERGVVAVSGRAKEMIIRGGENVYPREIEDALVALPGVLDAAVVGLPDDYYGEIVAAFVRPSPARPSPTELAAALRERLTGYKIPARWFYLDEFPLTASGKVQKFALAEGWRAGRYTEERT